MADHQDWRNKLTASERYDNIQRIQEAIESNEELFSGKNAFTIENEAYNSASAREDYDAACNISPSSGAQEPGLGEPSSPPYMHGKGGDGDNHDNDEAYEDDGERIGPYQNCQYIASGVTAEVFRCKDLALKVIIETHNIEPHDPFREAKILEQLKEPCIPLLDTFRDHEQRFTLVFPYMPLTLSDLLERGSISDAQVRRIFGDLFQALAHVHGKGIIHRDIKPQAILLASPDGPAYLSDFGTAWHPELSASTEPANAKILDIGTGPYRAPEVLFGDKSYGTAVDMWGAGCMLAECVRQPPKTLFESRAAHEDGNQLGLILSIFRTLGTPTRESWPEATCFKTPPFDIYRVFEGRPWDDILNGVDDEWKGLIKAMVRYDSGRMKAEQALQHPYLKGDMAV
ncbi:hypothetical protein VM1G_03701 [Cytospora mali]|uniref:cyclin-dependent kinase n=1 Tax=Cytospora mali TaxID=578113 RepID=A0A194VXA7_CYTMA|nr:hypothetical protein VM1G_03701 [Valsa mali]